MNTMKDMKRRRSLFGSIALSLLVIVGLMLGSAPAQAATVDSSLSIPVSTIFTAADGTKFTVSGNVVINCSAVTDATDVPPFVILTFDASGLTVTSGTGTKKKTYDTRGFQVIKTRPLQATDVITITVPNVQTGAALTTADRYNATFTLNFNAAGQITSGTVTASPAAAG
jgi:hypothetical protein